MIWICSRKSVSITEVVQNYPPRDFGFVEHRLCRATVDVAGLPALYYDAVCGAKCQRSRTSDFFTAKRLGQRSTI